MKKHLLYLTLLLLVFVSALKGVHAGVDTMNEHYQPIPDVFIWKKDPTGKRVAISHQMTMIVKNSNNQFVYCIEPGVSIDGTDLYTPYSTNQAYVAGMSDEQWKRIELLAYYGYNYVNGEIDHTDIKWYAVTQFMIWQTVPHGYDIYFSTSVYKNERIEKYTEEQQELERLVSQHEIKPQFEEKKMKLLLGDTKKIPDTNQVLSQYQLSLNTPDTITQDGNDLTIVADEVGTHSFSLLKKDDTYQHGAIVYLHPESQDVVEVGSYPTIKVTYTYEVVALPFMLQKLNREKMTCTSPGLSSLSGAVYGLYKEDGTLVTTLTIDSNCTARTEPILGMGTYYLKELKNPRGFAKDPQTYTIQVDNTDFNEERVRSMVFDSLIYKKIKVTKVEEDTGKIIPIANIPFKIYDTIEKKYICKKANDCIYYTDNHGEFSVDLYYSNYRLEEQQSATSGLLWNETPLSFTVDESSPDTLTLSFANKTVKGKIDIHKESEYGFPMDEVIFQVFANEDIYDIDGSILYHKGDVIATLTTNEEGNTSITGIPLGNYLVKEVETKEGYLLPEQTFEVSLLYQDEFTGIVSQSLDIVNYQIPNTLKHSVLFPISFLCICLGGLFLYEKKGTCLDPTL